MILVTVGTDEHPFDRLVAAAEALARDADEPVVLQRGTSREPAPHCEVHDLLPPRTLEQLVQSARVVVTHGGPGSILMAWSHGHAPVVVPRDPAHGEHVDDHQLRFVERIADRVRVVRDPSLLATAVADHEPRARVGRADEARSEAFARDLGTLVDAVLARRRARPGPFRATVAFLTRLGIPRR